MGLLKNLVATITVHAVAVPLRLLFYAIRIHTAANRLSLVQHAQGYPSKLRARKAPASTCSDLFQQALDTRLPETCIQHEFNPLRFGEQILTIFV